MDLIFKLSTLCTFPFIALCYFCIGSGFLPVTVSLLCASIELHVTRYFLFLVMSAAGVFSIYELWLTQYREVSGQKRRKAYKRDGESGKTNMRQQRPSDRKHKWKTKWVGRHLPANKFALSTLNAMNTFFGKRKNFTCFLTGIMWTFFSFYVAMS